MAKESYESLRAKARELAQDGQKVPASLMREKAQAKLEQIAETRKARRSEKRMLQESYIRGFPEEARAGVRTRLHDPAKYAELVAKSRS